MASVVEPNPAQPATQVLSARQGFTRLGLVIGLGGFVFAWNATPNFHDMKAGHYLFLVACGVLPMLALSLLGSVISALERSPLDSK